ncbi:MAG: hypothetical protein KDA33_09140 [Phycisphaerales bacterium]|nr:hypothetical protein [Phycisphaerales bacterium]
MASSLVAMMAGCWNPPADHVGVWSEFLPLDDVCAELPSLASRDFELYLAITPAMLDDPLARILRDAEVAGVPVRLWLELPDDGVWLNETNVAAFDAFSRTTLDWIDANGVDVDWLIFDIEPAFSYAEELTSALVADGVFGVLDLLEARRDADQYAASVEGVRRIVDTVHERGRRAMAVTLPWVTSDAEDGDSDLQDIFDTPVSSVEWDAVSIILYRSSLSELLGVSLSPGFVYDYARLVRSVHGADVEVAIGTISTPGLITSQGYTDPADLWLDLMAARSAGIRNISVYSLDGMLTTRDVDAWLDIARGPSVPLPITDPFSGLTPLLFDGLDSLADN